MDFKENKLEFSVGLIVVGGFGLIFALFQGISDRNPNFFSREVNYQMPRPHSQMPPDFSLEGREVDYDYNNPFEKKKAEDAKKKAEVKKATDKKKEANKTAQNKSKKDEQKKPAVTVDVVDADKNKMSDHQVSSGTGFRPYAYSAQPQRPASSAQDKKEDEKRSAEQWRSLLNAQPTRENMDQMVAAYNKGDLPADGFYLVIEDLMKNQKSETQMVAVYGLNKTPSGRSFVALAQHYEAMNADVKQSAQQAMMTYAQPSRVAALGQAMSSSNSKVAYYAMQVLQRGISGTSTISGRDLRSGQGSQNNQTGRYTQLIPVVQRLTQSQDMQVADLAAQLLAQLGGSQQQQRPGSNSQVASQQQFEQSIEMSSTAPQETGVSYR